MTEVLVHRVSPVMTWWSPEEERRVAAVVEACIREAGGGWVATVMHSAGLSRCWIVEIRPEEGGSARRVLLDEARSEPTAELHRALAEAPPAAIRRQA